MTDPRILEALDMAAETIEVLERSRPKPKGTYLPPQTSAECLDVKGVLANIAAAKQALANPSVTVEGELVRRVSGIYTSDQTDERLFDTLGDSDLPEGPCLVTVTSIKEDTPND